MRFTSGYASIWCILLHQLQPRDLMAPITRGMPNVPEPVTEPVTEPVAGRDFSPIRHYLHFFIHLKLQCTFPNSKF